MIFEKVKSFSTKSEITVSNPETICENIILKICEDLLSDPNRQIENNQIKEKKE